MEQDNIIQFKNGPQGDKKKQGICALFVLSWPLSSSYCKSDWFCSCTTKDLTVAGGQCSHGHTEALMSEFELGILWDEYDLVGDLVVCNHLVVPFYST